MQINKNNIHRQTYQGVPERNSQIRRNRHLYFFSLLLRYGLEHQAVQAAPQHAKIQPAKHRTNTETSGPALLPNKQRRNARERPKNECQPRDSLLSPGTGGYESVGGWVFRLHCHRYRRPRAIAGSLLARLRKIRVRPESSSATMRCAAICRESIRSRRQRSPPRRV